MVRRQLCSFCVSAECHSLSLRGQPWAKVSVGWPYKTKKEMRVLSEDSTRDGLCQEMVVAPLDMDPINSADVRVSDERRRKADPVLPCCLEGETGMREDVFIEKRWRLK